MKAEIERVIGFQEEVGLDVLVHGEPERNDMVQYFAEQMEGYAFTQNAWVQSYGSRYVRPPILYGDVNRPDPMTVEWILYAQSLTGKPVKGMLTGPVTMLQWSFVRDDQPRAETCEQLALAIRDEVVDLEEAGIGRDPGRRAGDPRGPAAAARPLGRVPAVGRRTASASRPRRVRDATQIHTHMCYSDFGDIMERIQEMDADVLLIEAARSRMELLHDWERTGFDNEIGPGVYDIHSPRVPPDRGDGRAAARGREGSARRAAVGEPRLRAEDPRLGGGRRQPAQHGPGGEAAARGTGPREVAGTVGDARSAADRALAVSTPS